MKTYLLVGIIKHGSGNFPKPLCTVQAENLAAAADKLGGHVHEAGKVTGQPFSAVFVPDAECAHFHSGPRTGALLADSVVAIVGQSLAASDIAALRGGSASMLKMFGMLFLGQLPMIG